MLELEEAARKWLVEATLDRDSVDLAQEYLNVKVFDCAGLVDFVIFLVDCIELQYLNFGYVSVVNVAFELLLFLYLFDFFGEKLFVNLF
jgi:hypothetical protein